MNILVTGASGFIGSHLVERLLENGHRVTCLDSVKLRPIQSKGNKRLVYHIVDISEYSQKIFLYFRNIDWVFHLAGRSDIVPSITNPVSYHNVNVTGTLHVLEASKRAKVKRFIYAASSSCYGIPDIYPTPETAQIEPQYPYALTKYMGEMYALAWAKIYKLPVVSLRFFNVYGPRSRISDDYGPVFSTFMAQKLSGKPFTVVGNGNQTRDFTFVSDVVDACITAAKSDVIGEAFNVGSGGTYSVNSLVKLLGGPIVHIPKRPGEPDCTWADITKIRKILKWKPTVSFEQGVKIVLDHRSDWIGSPVWTPAKIKKATKDWFSYLQTPKD